MVASNRAGFDDRHRVCTSWTSLQHATVGPDINHRSRFGRPLLVSLERVT